MTRQVLPQRSLAIVGLDFENTSGPSRRFELHMCQRGEPVELRPEPKNPADPQAVAVYSARGIQLGYLSAERAPWIGGMLKNGREIEAVFQEITASGAALRIAFDGAIPELPVLRAREDADTASGADEDSGFWPDEIWDD